MKHRQQGDDTIEVAGSSVTSGDEPIAEEVPARQLFAEVVSLPRQQRLFRSGPYEVCIARRPQIPNLMEEIGRLRELSFRQVGEGTGKARDIDEFDDWYLHLFTWDNDAQRVVGAYRLCMTDVVLRQLGLRGLYTRSLFEYDEALVQELSPAIELGRSFVRTECQGSGRGLALLWRGIGQLIASRPSYRRLFGPVSVSAAYCDGSRALIAATLSAGQHCHPLAGLVAAKRPPTLPVRPDSTPDARWLSKRVAELEYDNKGLPLLVREYIKLGGKFLSFSLDPAFGNAMDGLVSVDLDETRPRLLALYMGPENYERFRGAKPTSAIRPARVRIAGGQTGVPPLQTQTTPPPAQTNAQ
jgi:putative hemolysin